MNSKSLQEHFPEVYREFFSKCPIVVSAPRYFFWTGEHAVMYGAPIISQSLPFKTYIGLIPVSTAGIKIDSLKIFSQEINEFSEPNHRGIEQVKLINFLHNHFKIYNKTGLAIHVLSEAPNHGYGFPSSFAPILIVALKLFFKELLSEEINNWPETRIQNLIGNKKFDETFRLCWKAEIIQNLYNASGAHSFSTLLAKKSPLVYFKFPKSKGNEPDPLAKSSLDYPNYFNYQGLNITDISEEGNFIWPLDFGIIYSGIQKLTGSIVKSTGEIKDYLQNKVRKIVNEMDNKSQNNMLGIIKDKTLFSQYIKALSIYALESLTAFKELFDRGASQEALNKFSRSINLYRHGLFSIGVATLSLDHLLNLLAVNFFQKNISHFGIKTSGSGGGGAIIFCGPIGSFKKNIYSIIKNIKNKTKLDITLDYASWLDGYNDEGIKIEQNLEERIFSPFVSPEAVKITHLNPQGIMHTDLYTLEEFRIVKEKADILLDDVNNEIYVKGIRLTSKEIHSATTTIEIMKYLINNHTKSVRNTELPESSYAKDRNELQSKIISPLVNIVYKKTRKRLNLKIHGGLTEFLINIEPDYPDIHLLEKIF